MADQYHYIMTLVYILAHTIILRRKRRGIQLQVIYRKDLTRWDQRSKLKPISKLVSVRKEVSWKNKAYLGIFLLFLSDRYFGKVKSKKIRLKGGLHVSAI